MPTTVRDRTEGRNDRQEPNSRRSSSLRHQEKRAPEPVKSAHIITEYIDVAVPAETAFDLWTRYDKWSEMFKKESAEQGAKGGSKSGPDDSGSGSDGSDRSGRTGRSGQPGGRSGQSEIKVRAKIGPSERQWTAQIVGTEPGHRIDWRSKGPLQAMGTTTFHRLDDRLTKLMVEIEYRPSGLLEIIGNFFRMQRRRVRRDLRLFKNYAELKGVGDQEQSGDRSDQDDKGEERS